LHRNIRAYRFLLHVCRMRGLFERFLFNFYRHEQSIFRPRRRPRPRCRTMTRRSCLCDGPEKPRRELAAWSRCDSSSGGSVRTACATVADIGTAAGQEAGGKDWGRRNGPERLGCWPTAGYASGVQVAPPAQTGQFNPHQLLTRRVTTLPKIHRLIKQWRRQLGNLANGKGPSQQECTAYHEAGHAAVAIHLHRDVFARLAEEQRGAAI
jgi:hypothetical protein